MAPPNTTAGKAPNNKVENLDSVAEALLSTAIQHQALTPEEARSLAAWDLTTITEYLALRLQKHGLLSPRECKAVLGYAADSEH